MWWLVFPLVWTAYTLIRGAIVDWYPYPFLDHRLHSIGVVALYVVGIAVAFFVVEHGAGLFHEGAEPVGAEAGGTATCAGSMTGLSR